MRPIRVGPYSPVTASTTAFNAQTFNSTGAATAVTNPATSDGLAHLVTLTSPVQATLAGITFTIVGTDADGNSQTETGLVGPASASTVTSSKYFKTIVTIQPSATMGALVVSVGIAAASSSPALPLERESIAAANIFVDITGTINFTVNETFENIFNYPEDQIPWVPITALTTKTADSDATADIGATAIQLITNSVTNGATYIIRINHPTQQMG